MNTVNSYKTAKELLGNRTRRKLENNTYLETREDGSLAVKLHQTDVVIYKENGDMVLTSGGWKTMTTKDRINKYTRWGTVTQKNNQWFLKGSFVFVDGVTITAKGAVKGATKQTKTLEKAFVSQKKTIKKFCTGFVDALFKGEVKAPSGGDCWHCCMVTEEGKTLGEVSSDHADHIKQHIKENYFVPSLLHRALEAMPTSIFTKGTIGDIWRGKETNPFDKKYAMKETKKNLYRYIMRQFGNASSVINFK